MNINDPKLREFTKSSPGVKPEQWNPICSILTGFIVCGELVGCVQWLTEQLEQFVRVPRSAFVRSSEFDVDPRPWTLFDQSKVVTGRCYKSAFFLGSHCGSPHECSLRKKKVTSLAPALAPQLGLLGSPPDPVGRFTMRVSK